MARRKNVKRIDPRYFLNETVNRGEEIEEGFMDMFKKKVWDKSTVRQALNIWHSKAKMYYPGKDLERWMNQMWHSTFSGKSIEKAAGEYLKAAEKNDPGGEMAAQRDRGQAPDRTPEEWVAWGEEIRSRLRQ